MGTAIIEQAKFDTRLPKEQKLFFEKAAMLGGYSNLTDFIVHAAPEKAEEIMKERELIIASERDCEFFFSNVIRKISC